jgi:hypothetical protein
MTVNLAAVDSLLDEFESCRDNDCPSPVTYDDIILLRAAIAELRELREATRWRDISDYPMGDESTSYLAHRARNAHGERLVQQVSAFEGSLYPDEKGGMVDYSDRITDATHYLPLPAAPGSGDSPIPPAEGAPTG